MYTLEKNNTSPSSILCTIMPQTITLMTVMLICTWYDGLHTTSSTKNLIDLFFPTLDRVCYDCLYITVANTLPTIKSITTIHSQIHKTVHSSYIRFVLLALMYNK